MKEKSFRIESLDIGGKVRPFRPAIKLLRQMARKKGNTKSVELAATLADIDGDNLAEFVFEGLSIGLKKQDKKPNFTVGDVQEWLDDEPHYYTSLIHMIGDEVTQGKVSKAMAAQEAAELAAVAAIVENGQEGN